MFKLKCTLFITAIIFFILTILSNQNSNSSTTFNFISGILWSIWLEIVQYTNSIKKFFLELFRFCIFLIIFSLSLYYCFIYIVDSTLVNTICVYLSCFGIFLSTFYFISKIISMIIFFKKITSIIITKLYNTSDLVPNKIKALIENVTAFLVAIGGLLIAIKVITESIFQLMNYFK